jgi:hypothetical protein
MEINSAFLNFREIILLNRMVAVLLITLTIYLPFEIIFNGWDLILFMLFNYSIIASTLFFNYKRKYNFARWFFLGTSIFAVAPLILVVPEETYYPLLMVPVSMIPAVIFKEKSQAILGFFLVAGLYFVLFYFNENVEDIINLE